MYPAKIEHVLCNEPRQISVPNCGQGICNNAVPIRNPVVRGHEPSYQQLTEDFHAQYTRTFVQNVELRAECILLENMHLIPDDWQRWRQCYVPVGDPTLRDESLSALSQSWAENIIANEPQPIDHRMFWSSDQKCRVQLSHRMVRLTHICGTLRVEECLLLMKALLKFILAIGNKLVERIAVLRTLTLTQRVPASICLPSSPTESSITRRLFHWMYEPQPSPVRKRQLPMGSDEVRCAIALRTFPQHRDGHRAKWNVLKVFKALDAEYAACALNYRLPGETENRYVALAYDEDRATIGRLYSALAVFFKRAHGIAQVPFHIATQNYALPLLEQGILLSCLIIIYGEDLATYRDRRNNNPSPVLYVYFDGPIAIVDDVQRRVDHRLRAGTIGENVIFMGDLSEHNTELVNDDRPTQVLVAKANTPVFCSRRPGIVPRVHVVAPYQ